MPSTFLMPSFAKGEISPSLFGRTDTAAYRIALATARNVIVRAQGGVVNRPGLDFVGYAASNAAPSRLRRFRFNISDTYMLEFGNLTMRVIRNDAFVTEAFQTIGGFTAGPPATLTVAAHGWSTGDRITIWPQGGITRLQGRVFNIVKIDTSNISLLDPVTGLPVDGSTYGAFVGGGLAARIYTLATPYLQADLATLKFVQSADTLTITHPSYPEGKLTRSGDAAWTLTNPAFTPVMLAPTGVAVTPVTTGTTSASYVVTATNNTTGEESLPCATVTIANSADPLTAATKNTVSWSASANASTYSVYKGVNGVFGFIGYTPALTFLDNNFAPVLSTTPPSGRNPFAGGTNNPSCSTYYQQRQVRAGSNLNPATIYYSQTANFYNYSVSVPTGPADAITATLTSREVNAVRHMVPGKDLVVFTAGSEWRINSSGQGFAADTMEQIPQSSWGCSHLEPIVIGLTTLFVPENQRMVRTLSYTYVSDAYQGTDVTLLASHLLEQYTIVSWAFGRAPDPVVYSVRSDGVALCLTFQEEQQVTAWTRWDTSGTFEAVDVVKPNSAEPDDVAYFQTKRVVNGATVRYIERLHSRRFIDVRDCYFMDAGLTYDHPTPITMTYGTNPVAVTCPNHGFSNGAILEFSDITWAPVVDDNGTEVQPDQINGRTYTIFGVTPNGFFVQEDGTAFTAYASGGNVRQSVSTVFGLDHLEGRSVAVLADGNVVTGLSVANGAVTLPYPAARIHVGLPYTSDIETLDFESPQGTIQGKYKRASDVTVRLNKSRGLYVGQNTDELVEMKWRQYEEMGNPTDLVTGDKVVVLGSDWNANGRIFLRQKYPLPMEILAIIPNFDIEG